MPYLTCIGPGGTRTPTVSGLKSRAYHIYRRGTHVHCWWGPVTVDRRGRAGMRLLGTAPWQGLIRKFRSETSAGDFLSQRVWDLLSVEEGYQECPQGVRIRYRKGFRRR